MTSDYYPIHFCSKYLMWGVNYFSNLKKGQNQTSRLICESRNKKHLLCGSISSRIQYEQHVITSNILSILCTCTESQGHISSWFFSLSILFCLFIFFLWAAAQSLLNIFQRQLAINISCFACLVF